MVGALVEVQAEGKSTYTDGVGKFTINELQKGNFTLRISFLGYETLDTEIKLEGESTTHKQVFLLTIDPLEISKVIVTGSFDERSKLESSITVSTLSSQEMWMWAAKGWHFCSYKIRAFIEQCN